MHAGRALIVVLWSGLTLASTVGASDLAPTAPTIDRIDRSLRDSGRVRVMTVEAHFVVGGVRVDSTGVRWSKVLDRGGVDTLRAPGSLPWGRFIAIEKRTHRGAGSAKRGAIQVGTAAAVGAGVAAAVSGGDVDSLGPAFFAGVLGAGVGALFGALIGTPLPQWEQVYPPQAP